MGTLDLYPLVSSCSVWFSSSSGLLLMSLLLWTPLGSCIVPFALGFVCACLCLGQSPSSPLWQLRRLPELCGSDSLFGGACVCYCLLLCASSPVTPFFMPWATSPSSPPSSPFFFFFFFFFLFWQRGGGRIYFFVCFIFFFSGSLSQGWGHNTK